MVRYLIYWITIRKDGVFISSVFLFLLFHAKLVESKVPQNEEAQRESNAIRTGRSY